MTFMLASVTGPQEADTAVRHGADIIDVKDVREGFGAVDAGLVGETAKTLARRRPLSAVTGTPDVEPAGLTDSVAAIAAAGATYVKIALFPGDRRVACIQSLAPLAGRIKLIGVMFADHGLDETLLDLLAATGFTGAMVDTLRKAAGRLLDHVDIAAVGRFVDATRNRGLMAGLAGSLEPPDIPRLLLSAPDVLGFRRALCAGQDRTGGISAAAVDVVRALIPKDARRMESATATPRVDYRLLAARGYAFDPDAAETDHIFVRDFTLSVRIGAYAYEHDKPQKVRFDVDVEVLRLDHAAQDIRDVFSYDVITDAIRMIVAQEHISLVEMLAERIAAVVLTHPRVMCAKVRVEKTEVGPSGVGVEIVRRRPREVAKVHHLYPIAGDQ